MPELPKTKMSVDEFLLWAEQRPGRHELFGGRVHAMAPERARHARTKAAVHTALTAAIAVAGMPCEAFPEGMTVRVDETTAFEPDALVHCGPRISGDAIEVLDPMIVVEVLSPSTRSVDTGAKLIGYFAVPSVRHYLIVDPDRRIVVHHRRDGEAIVTRILGSDLIRLDPPGLKVPVPSLFREPPVAV